MGVGWVDNGSSNLSTSASSESLNGTIYARMKILLQYSKKHDDQSGRIHLHQLASTVRSIHSAVLSFSSIMSASFDSNQLPVLN